MAAILTNVHYTASRRLQFIDNNNKNIINIPVTFFKISLIYRRFVVQLVIELVSVVKLI